MPPSKVWSDDSKWNFASKYGPPDLVIKSPDYTIPAVAQDAWWRPVVDTGITEPRWVRAIEIRPSTIKGRRVTHHALAHLQQVEDMPKELFTNDPDVAGDGLFMEWAVGKPGDEMRPGSGRLMLPGSKIVFEMHYHAIGEPVTDHVELAVYFYPKGQEPKHREVLALFSTITGGNRGLDILPNQITTTESFSVLKENARIENFQAHMHLRGKGMSMEAILPRRPSRDAEPGHRFQFQLAQHVHLRRRCGAAPAEGHDAALRILVGQHGEQPLESGSRSVGRLGRSDGRRDGPRLDQHHLLQGR